MKRKTLVVLGMLFSLSVAACGGKPDSEVKEDTAVVNQSETQKEDTQAQTEQIETESETEEVLEVIHAVGEMVQLKHWEITVTNIQAADQITSDIWEFTPSGEGNKFAQVSVTVNNKGTESDTFLPSLVYNDDVMATIVYGDEEFTQTQLLNYDKDLATESIDAGASMEGEMIFEIPEAVASATDELLLQFQSGDEIVSYKLR
ncbi:MAG: DUF4352 domain-containing protein [Eubacterium sp.]|nr:DUF4352 domain-containing protein [Eubacterium sp.]